ncbi:hypothetical protein K8S17_04985 [bacterium]|nr:hypothetical protein [bacterium]
MKIVTRTFLVALAVLLAVAAGCSSGEEQGETGVPPTDGEVAESAARVEETEISRAAQSRGVAVSGRDPDAELQPVIVLAQVTYEWRLSPQKGLHVTLEFINPNDTYERARGYVFAIANYRASASAVYGVYPWGTDIDDGGLPCDYSKGTHLLFRRDQDVRAFIPYENSQGFYDGLRVLVYSEDGDMLIDSTMDLEVSGEPTGPVKSSTTLTL